MTVASERQKLKPDTLVALLTITKTDGTIIRLTNSVRDPGTSVTFGSNTFSARRFSLGRSQVKASGTLPRPTLSIDNTDNFMLTQVGQNLDGLNRAEVQYREVYAGNLVGGSDPDPSQISVENNYQVRQVKRLDGHEAQLTLQVPMDAEQVQFGRQCLRSTCARTYRVPDPNNNGQFFQGTCPYVGTNYFTKDGTSSTNYLEDDCGQRLSDCRARFGQNAVLPIQLFNAIGSPST